MEKQCLNEEAQGEAGKRSRRGGQALHALCSKERPKEPDMTVIEIPDDQAAALEARALAQGLTLKRLAQKAGGRIAGARTWKAA